MWAALLLAAAVAAPPLAVWPVERGPATAVVDDVEIYALDPEPAYAILAVQAFSVPVARGDEATLKRLATLARKLGADAVVLLGEMPESAIPEDLETPLPSTGRAAAAAFVVFEPCDSCPDDGARATQAAVRDLVIQRPNAPRARKMSDCTAVRYWTASPRSATSKNEPPSSRMSE